MNRICMNILANNEMVSSLPVDKGDIEIIVQCDSISNIGLYKNGIQILDMAIDDYLRMMKAKKWDYIFDRDLFTLFVDGDTEIPDLRIKISSYDDCLANIYIKKRGQF